VPEDAGSVVDTRRQAYVAFTDILGRVQRDVYYVEVGKPSLSSLFAECLEAWRTTVRPSTWDSYIEFQSRLPETLEAISAAGLADTSGFSLLGQLSENMRLRLENALLQRGLGQIEERLARIEATLPEVKVVVLREISRDEAKREIKQLFARGRALYYEDIVDEVRLDLELVVDICNELVEEGEISPVA
jgi:regulator of replication initiation timing